MKPRSVIFLIIAGILIVSGIVVCAVGSGKAAAEGSEIYAYSYDEGDRTVTEVDLSSEAIGKITLDLDRCNVHIVGGGERPTAVLTGFEKYHYSLSTTGGELKIKDGFGPAALIGMSSDGISFDGLRYLFPFVSRGIRTHADMRDITVTLPDELAVRKISITVKNGDVTLESLGGKADITVNVEDGSITSVGRTGESISLSADTGKGDIRFENPIYVGKSNLHTAQGDILIGVKEQTECEYQLLAPMGNVSVYGADAGDDYVSATSLPTKLTATADNGSITLSEPGTEAGGSDSENGSAE